MALDQSEKPLSVSFSCILKHKIDYITSVCEIPSYSNRKKHFGPNKQDKLFTYELKKVEKIFVK